MAITSKEGALRIEGLDDFRRTLAAANAALPKELAAENQRVGINYFLPEARSRAQSRSNPRPGHQVIDSIRANKVQSGVVVSMGRNSVPWAVGHEFGSSQRRSTGKPHGHTTQFPVRSGKFGRGNAGYFFYPAVRATAGKIRDAYGDVLDRLMKRAFPD